MYGASLLIRGRRYSRLVNGRLRVTEAAEEDVGKLDRRFEAIAKLGFRGQQLADLQTNLGCLELVRLGDAPLGRAVFEHLRRAVEGLFDLPVNRQDHVGPVGNDQPPGL